MIAKVGFNLKVLSMFLAVNLFSASLVYADRYGYCNDLSVDRIRTQKFTVPDQSTVFTKLTPDSEEVEVKLFSPVKYDQLMVNYRRPFLHAEITDVLAHAHMSLEQLNKIFGKSDATIDSYQAIAHFAHGFVNYKTPFERPTNSNDKTQFWYAIMPSDAVLTSAAVQVEWFADGVGNHMQLHLSLDKNILLLPANLEKSGKAHSEFKVEDRTKAGMIDIFGKMDGPVLIKGEMVYALMGLKAAFGPQDFSFVNGITGNLTVGLTLASAGHMATDQMSRGSFIEEYSLKFSPEELQRTYDYILDQNAYIDPTENLYNTVFQNCIKEVMIAINFGLGERVKTINYDQDQFNPYTVPNYLINKGLVDPQPILLNTKFVDYKLVNQSRVTSQNEKTIKNLDSAFKLVNEKDLEFFIRQFAYSAAVNKWKNESINDYFEIMGEKIKSHELFKSFQIEKYIYTDAAWKDNKNKEEIVQIDASVKKIIKDILHIESDQELEPKDFQKYFDLVPFILSIKN